MENTIYNNMEKITGEPHRNIEHKELETLKQQKMKFGIDEVCKLVQHSLEDKFYWKLWKNFTTSDW